MLRRLKLTCFSQHEDREWIFENGLIAVRGPNEAGKSRMLMGVLYALGGAKALPLPLAEVVTWGRGERELAAELDIEIEGVRYAFTRSPAGAECNYAGGKVTGQKEVTSFAAELLGGDFKVLTRLLLAKQNGIRGALEDGPTAVAAQIEALADFDLLDSLIRKITANRVTGPTASLEKRVQEWQQRLDNWTLVKPDTFAQDALIEALRLELDRLEADIANRLENAAKEADRRFLLLDHQQRLHEMADRAYREATTALEQATDQRDRVRDKANLAINEARLEQATFELGECLDAERRLSLYRDVTALAQTYPASCWEGDRASFEAEQEATHQKILDLTQQVGKVRGLIAVKMSQLVTAGLCGFCGQDFSQFPEAERKNAILRREIAEQERQVQQLDGLLAEAQDYRRTLGLIADLAKPHEAYPIVPDYMDKDTNFVPPKIRWKGQVPSEVIRHPHGLRVEVGALRTDLERRDRAREQLPALEQAVLDAQRKAVQAGAERHKNPSMPERHRAYLDLQNAESALDDAKNRVSQARPELDVAQQQRQLIMVSYEASKKAREEVERQLTQAKDDLALQIRNNILLKKVRAARPLIADQLWNTVLQSVSVIVTQMRKQPSNVSKDGDGFKINGKLVEAYSGSAMDLLGLAIRCALMKTFLPQVSLLVLDEATAACDADRTEAMLGYLAASGFDQILLVTHEEISETYANQVIQL